ncbi:MAG: hypothetical protein ABR527_07290 [Gemmatimonadota bacterium]
MSRSKPMLWRAVLLSALVLPLLPGPALAQPAAQPADTTQAATLAALRDGVQERYQVLPLQNGVVLIPKYGTTDIQSIELAAETIAINGQPVTGAELRQRIPADADLVIRLSFLDAQTRQVLFGLGTPPAGPSVSDTTTVAAGTPLPEGAAASEEDDDIEVDIDAGEDRVRVGGSIHVEADETVDGDVVAVFGSVRVDGRVTGDVVAVLGSLDLGPAAVVEGEVVVVGGRLNRASGAEIHGGIEEVTGPSPVRFRHGDFDAPAPWGGIGGVIGTVMWIVVLGLLTCLALLLARRPIERMEYRVRTSPWKAAAVGLAAELLFFPALVLVVVVLAISIVGIPLLLVIPFAILALAIGILLGFTAVAKAVGHSAEGRFGWSHANTYVTLLVGVGLVMAVSFFASVLGMAGGPLKVFSIILGIIGFVIQWIAWTVGFGVLLLTRFGTRYHWGEVERPAPPAPYEPEPVGAGGIPAPPAGD